MKKESPISIFIDHNEKNGDRANAIILEASTDERFLAPEWADLVVDVEFRNEDYIYRAELKETYDYVHSALGKTGRLYEQYLGMAEAGDPCIVLVLGGDRLVALAVRESLASRYDSPELEKMTISYVKRLFSYETAAAALGVPVERWEMFPYMRLLSRARKFLQSASLIDHRPKPVQGERQIAALCMLVPGIGDVRSRTLLAEYGNILKVINKAVSKDWEDFQELPGIGPKTAYTIHSAISGLQ